MNRKSKIILLVFLISIFFFMITFYVPYRGHSELHKMMIKASQNMSTALNAVKNCRLEKGIEVNSEFDINQTAIIGKENSPITTSVGNLKAKRTTTNPNFAGLMVKLLHESGVKSGDSITVEASGYFLGLVLSVFSAARAMVHKVIFILSLGDCQWGANELDFHVQEIHGCLFD